MRDLGVLHSVARALVAPGKGILAADESTSTINKRFGAIHVESNPESHRAYRDMLFTTPGVEEFISGVILYDETIRQSSLSGTPFPKLLKDKGIIPGIKVDEGAKDMAGFPGEKITEGLDGLRGRLKEYRDLGAQFAKWRAVITIGENIPTRTCLESNAEALARYAALCQEADIVPIVEPEVLMDGSHTLQRCEEVTLSTLELVFDRLFAHRILLEGMLLKPNMVIPGNESGQNATPKEIAEATIRTFKRVVPAAVPGIVFLSGGQSPEEATENLNAMNQHKDLPWKLSFSYGRALQDPPMHAWAGNEKNVEEGRKLFYLRAQCNSAAQLGRYTPEMETAKV
jgi:fructose-bisphosphate aldolase class I